MIILKLVLQSTQTNERFTDNDSDFFFKLQNFFEAVIGAVMLSLLYCST